MQTYLHQCHKMAKTPQNMAMIQPWVDLSDIYNYYTDIRNRGGNAKTWRAGCKTWT